MINLKKKLYILYRLNLFLKIKIFLFFYNIFNMCSLA